MKEHQTKDCVENRRAIQDTMEAMSGKWKLIILVTLLTKSMRFKELAREINISPRMLSKELQEMELNELISRTVYEAKPIAVEYAITEYGMTLEKVLFEMAEWGKKHKKRVIMGEHEYESVPRLVNL